LYFYTVVSSLKVIEPLTKNPNGLEALMKKILLKNILVVMLGLIGFSVQVAAAPSDDQKYIFEDLEQVPSFLNWRVYGWQPVDSRSLIITLSPSESYLLVLERNLWAIKYTENIRISSTGSRIRSNIDRVFVDDRIVRPQRIDAIYLLPDRETRNSIRARIRGEEPQPVVIPTSGEVL
jgi:hypothetical protein